MSQLGYGDAIVTTETAILYGGAESADCQKTAADSSSHSRRKRLRHANSTPVFGPVPSVPYLKGKGDDRSMREANLPTQAALHLGWGHVAVC